ncbi:cation-binding protein [Dietzia sp. UCD-THP]|uniref:Cation-binding protein n=1 Tax=Dietzia natronolimnaea TaxID=161920 RepID=A0A2A2WMK7_9ACTN|nr:MULTISPECIES: hemerythrin domain-containing protein [Dietzia]EYT65656.1 cation-binding protein [Dietzia sp. UCD-THP]PAY22428.1 cation-binding protein [Dietzia natronolimnaea]
MAQTSATESHQDVVDILTADHREMIGLIEMIEETTDPSERRALADSVIAEVTRHSVAEELFVYPVYEREIPDGGDEVEHDKKEHQEIEEVMKELEGLDSESAEFIATVKRFKELLDHHADDEETDQFPKLRAAVSAEDLLDLGRKVEAAKKIAPTRPHPGSPHSELFHMTLGPGVGMVDRLRDALSGRLKNT